MNHTLEKDKKSTRALSLDAKRLSWLQHEPSSKKERLQQSQTIELLEAFDYIQKLKMQRGIEFSEQGDVQNDEEQIFEEDTFLDDDDDFLNEPAISARALLEHFENTVEEPRRPNEKSKEKQSTTANIAYKEERYITSEEPQERDIGEPQPSEKSKPLPASWLFLNLSAATILTLGVVFLILPTRERFIPIYKGTTRHIGQSKLRVWKKTEGQKKYYLHQNTKISLQDRLELSYSLKGKEKGYPYLFAKQKDRIYMLKPWLGDADEPVQPGDYQCCTDESTLELQFKKSDRGSLEFILIFSSYLLPRPRVDKQHLVFLSNTNIFFPLLESWQSGKMTQKRLVEEIKKLDPNASFDRLSFTIE